MAKTKDISEVIRKTLAADADIANLVEEESFNADIATEIYNARIDRGVSQSELANLVSTQQSVISRLENADYDGHSLTMLKRIARALGKRLRVEFFAPQCFATNHAAVAGEFCAGQWKGSESWQPEVSITSDSKMNEKAT